MKIKPIVVASALLLLSLDTLTAQVTYRIYATREGLVGGRTANGHIITTRDHFVALPSGTTLNCNGCTTYKVNLFNPSNGRVKNGVPQWDVGPWNTKDNYWHVPRQMWQDLPRGKPEAQAAYQDGYNNGRDEFGRVVANPAGIDLADGTFWDDMGMVGNGWIDVTFTWESTGFNLIKDNAQTGFTASASWVTATSSADKYGSNYRYRSTAAVSDAATWAGSLPSTRNYSAYAWWPQGSNRSLTAPYIVSTSAGSSTVNKNQQINGGKFNLLGTWNMNSGNNTIKLSCWTTTGYVVMADAVRWSY